MSLSTTLRNVASKILVTQGQTVTIRHEAESAFNPESGERQSETIRFTASGVVDAFNKSELDAGGIEGGDIKFVLEAAGNTPVNGDVVTIEGVDYRIMNVSPVSPAGVHIVYGLHLRK